MTHYPNAADLPVVWTKAQASNPNENCVECAAAGNNTVALRDSKDPSGPAHLHPEIAFGAFLTAVATNTLVPVA
ncbi:DUF397 domain-containing protein [Kitasatospora sp. NPDC048545]|uniref:DUF397 domain-containing protein n=1 Tax=Kitasatospora sp. NPDC048545 TaxID=3157208 RepID=UPI0033E3D6BB